MAPMNNSLVLTAHSRLANWLLLDHNRQQKQKKAWETAKYSLPFRLAKKSLAGDMARKISAQQNTV